MFYPQEIIDEILGKTDIVKIISKAIKRLDKKGDLFLGFCPFHNETTPSFSVSRETQTFKCFGCGTSGNVIDFVMKFNKCSFVDAVIYLASETGVFLPDISVSTENISKDKETLLKMNRIAARFFYDNRSREGLKYLLDRGLTMETIQKFGLGCSKSFGKSVYQKLKNAAFTDEEILSSGLVSYGDVHYRTGTSKDFFDKFWDRVMFPIIDENNKVIGFGGRVMNDGAPKYLNSPETAVFSKSDNLYGLNLAKYSTRPNIMLVEGYMDVISMHQAGFDNAVASLGTALTSGQVKLIKKYSDEVILSYDSDGPGTNAAIRAISMLTGAGLSVKVVNLTPTKDPDEFVKRFGKEAMEKRLNEAESSERFILKTKKDTDQYYEMLADILLKKDRKDR